MKDSREGIYVWMTIHLDDYSASLLDIFTEAMNQQEVVHGSVFERWFQRIKDNGNQLIICYSFRLLIEMRVCLEELRSRLHSSFTIYED